MPPAAARVVAGYAAPAWPAGSSGGVVMITAGSTVIDSWAVEISTAGAVESVTVTVNSVAPAVAGLPVMVPSGARVSPVGNDDPVARDQEYGGVPPDAVSELAG